ncbi:1-deoxy-D-xylulose-5-phosphate synthase [Spiroplasma sabaudiense Ar-1343]|uniref:1-deoxy-D-xylulose-5-phosphate synthase n=1 Tax=Spiroplasma sabaudiense Ar-1343 TaxID=1276257 RepID=W6AA61_9MOLU|nr:1-deoxy-D-xylulose-5-phosphate synthase N-terminal domain-containing protein [Spiroplasma sabaudiense]AHI53896.1 1-deoxy-D-xylulose-5-phosphate synthase [Spiroplasma sabaudiense Ar-1343]
MKLVDYKDWNDIFDVNIECLNDLITDLRFFLIDYVQENGGHLGSNLGVLEITVGIINVFGLKNSKILFDTGHQSHFYKILTNRKFAFEKIKSNNKVSNFQEHLESEFDHISNGHSSTALSIALGHKISNPEDEIIVIIGDAALLNGVALEGLVAIANQDKKIIIVYNDNDHGIGENFLKINNPKKFFESLGFEYHFEKSGNDIEKVIDNLKIAKSSLKSTVLHLKTLKSNGFLGSDRESLNHSINKKPNLNVTNLDQVVKNFYLKKLQNGKSLSIISPGMLISNKLLELKKMYPKNVFDVGINEEHALLLGVGLALNNQRVIISIYSTFLQRAYDQLVHDVFRNNLPITFLIEKVGFSWNNGISHHGIYDLAICQTFNNAIIGHPRSEFELNIMLEQSFNNLKAPFFIRLENNVRENKNFQKKFEINEYELINFNEKNKATLFTYGENLNIFEEKIFSQKLPINLVNARFLNKLDEKVLAKVMKTEIFVYEHVISKSNLATLFREKQIEIVSYSVETHNVGSGDETSWLKDLKLDYDSVVKKILNKK